MKRRTILILLVIVAAVATAICRQVFRIRSFEAAFAKITRETNEAGVMESMGQPDRVNQSATQAFWNDTLLSDDVSKQVVKEYWYTVRVPPVPISWTVGFDSNGRVISKHRLD